MKPEEVQHSKFVVQKVFFNNGSFSMAWGTYQGDPAIGQRWNGEEGSIGYPSSRGRPVWFRIDPAIEQTVLGGLATAQPQGTDVEALAAILKIRASLGSGAGRV